MIKPIKISAFGSYLPEKVSSSDLEMKYGLPLGWSEKYSGVKSRHHVTFESNGYMGAKAADQALENAGLNLSDVSLLISASGTYDYPIPNQASVIKAQMKDGISANTPAIDIDSTCLSFVTAFEIAANLFDNKNYKHILIVCSEISSKAINPSNWETLTLFGDAAVAVLVSYDESLKSHYIKGGQKTYSEGVHEAMIEGGGNKNFFKEYSYSPELHSFKMNGRQLLRLAHQKIPDFMAWFFKDSGYLLSDLDAIIPHQASKTGNAVFSQLYDLEPGVIKSNLADRGNCIAASIPLALMEAIAIGEIKRGDVCLISGTSAGFSIGGVLFKY